MKERLSILLILIIFANNLFAQENSKVVLDLKKSVAMALESNNDYQQSKLAREKADEQVTEAYGSSLFPNIKGNINYNRAIRRPEFIIETPLFSGRFPVGSTNTLTSSVNVEQPLFTGAMFLAVRIAETFADISQQGLEFSKIQLVLNVKQSYYNYLLSDKLVELAEIQLQRAEENKNNTKKMYDAGLVSEYDYIKANVQYQNTLPALTEAQNQKSLAENNLKLAVGIDFNSKIEVADSLSYSYYDIPNFEDGLERVIKQNKLLKQKELEVELQDLSASYEFTQHFPKLNAVGSWQMQAQEEDERAFSNWRYSNSVSVGLSLSIPIFNGLTTNSKVEQAELDYKIALEGLSKVKKQLKNDYENTVLSIRKTQEQIEAYKASVSESKRGFEIATKRFNSGLGTQIELTSALYETAFAEVNFNTSIYQYLVYTAQLDLILGKSLEEIKL
ncbi:MAG: TolC family protein [Melioribacteraceae bacterium]|nr:TolC family protein [Melioribacteraceae bacterium]